MVFVCALEPGKIRRVKSFPWRMELTQTSRAAACCVRRGWESESSGRTGSSKGWKWPRRKQGSGESKSKPPLAASITGLCEAQSSNCTSTPGWRGRLSPENLGVTPGLLMVPSVTHTCLMPPSSSPGLTATTTALSPEIALSCPTAKLFLEPYRIPERKFYRTRVCKPTHIYTHYDLNLSRKQSEVLRINKTQEIS